LPSYAILDYKGRCQQEVQLELEEILLLVSVADRDAFIERLEATWGGIYLPLQDASIAHLRPGVRTMQAALEWATAADEEGVRVWLDTVFQSAHE
jgi:hypothetical protein